MNTDTVFVRPGNPPSRAFLDKLSPLPGFNVRIKTPEYEKRVKEYAESMIKHGFFEDRPLAVVMMEGDDTIYVYDGNTRLDAARAASLDGVEFGTGLPIAWAGDGSSLADLTIHMEVGAGGNPMNMVESAAIVKRLIGIGKTKTEAAEALNRSPRHIDYLLVLGDAPSAIQAYVVAGKFAGAEAVRLLIKDPATALAIMQAKVEANEAKAAERAAAKANRKSGERKTSTGPKMILQEFEHVFHPGGKMSDQLKALATVLREHIAITSVSGDLVAAEAKVKFKLAVIDVKAEEAAKAAAEAKKKKVAEAAANKAATSLALLQETLKKVNEQRAAAGLVPVDANGQPVGSAAPDIAGKVAPAAPKSTPTPSKKPAAKPSAKK